MDGWRKLSGGNSLGHRRRGSAFSQSLPTILLEFEVVASDAEPIRRGSTTDAGNLKLAGPPLPTHSRWGLWDEGTTLVQDTGRKEDSLY